MRFCAHKLYLTFSNVSQLSIVRRCSLTHTRTHGFRVVRATCSFSYASVSPHSPRHRHTHLDSHHQIRLVQSAPNTHGSRLLTECHWCRRRSVRSFTHQLIRLIHSGRKYKMRYRRTPYTQSFLTRQCVQTRNHKPKLWNFSICSSVFIRCCHKSHISKITKKIRK